MITEEQSGPIRFGLSKKDAFDSTERPVQFIRGHNLGNDTLLLCLPFEDFLNNSFIPNEANIAASLEHAGQPVTQRPLSLGHATGLAKYMLKGVLKEQKCGYEAAGEEAPIALERLVEIAGPQPYMGLQPIVANLRNFKLGDLRFNTETNSVYLGKRHILYIIDGQHRFMGMDLLRQYVSEILLNYSYPKKPDLLPEMNDREDHRIPGEELQVWNKVRETFHGNCTVMLEVHLGLRMDEERQLFHDLNNHSRRVETGLALKYDQSNPVNMYIKEKLEGPDRIFSPVIVDRDVKGRGDDETVNFTRKDMNAINAILFLNKFNAKAAQPSRVEKFTPHADEFWKMVDSIPGMADPKIRTVATQPVVLKALANLYYLYTEGKDANENLIAILVNGVRDGLLDFSHGNPLWHYYDLPEAERGGFYNQRNESLESYLPQTEVPMIGVYKPKEGVMQFSNQHNSIFPILGDMIRWQLGLPPRKRRNKDNRDKKKSRR